MEEPSKLLHHTAAAPTLRSKPEPVGLKLHGDSTVEGRRLAVVLVIMTMAGTGAGLLYIVWMVAVLLQSH